MEKNVNSILAVVAIKKEDVAGGAPIFFVRNKEEQQTTAFLLEKILDASAHDLNNGIFILVKH